MPYSVVISLSFSALVFGLKDVIKPTLLPIGDQKAMIMHYLFCKKKKSLVTPSHLSHPHTVHPVLHKTPLIPDFDDACIVL